jgi:nucleotidyltransferase substrate binding protein (TIGR01987 family)
LNKINPTRWQQRFSNYQSTLVELKEAVNQTSLNKLEKQGLIKAFEYTFELAWKTLQDYIQCLGIPDIVGPRPVITEAFKLGLISQGENWLELLEDRNSTAHVYNKNFADHLVEEIRMNHIKLLLQLENTFKLKIK